MKLSIILAVIAVLGCVLPRQSRHLGTGWTRGGRGARQPMCTTHVPPHHTAANQAYGENKFHLSAYHLQGCGRTCVRPDPRVLPDQAGAHPQVPLPRRQFKHRALVRFLDAYKSRASLVTVQLLLLLMHFVIPAPAQQRNCDRPQQARGLEERHRTCPTGAAALALPPHNSCSPLSNHPQPPGATSGRSSSPSWWSTVVTQ